MRSSFPAFIFELFGCYWMTRDPKYKVFIVIINGGRTTNSLLALESYKSLQTLNFNVYINFFQGQLFSYSDSHRHHLGANYHQIHVNCPYATRTWNYQWDRPMTVDGNQGNTV